MRLTVAVQNLAAFSHRAQRSGRFNRLPYCFKNTPLPAPCGALPETREVRGKQLHSLRFFCFHLGSELVATHRLSSFEQIEKAALNLRQLRLHAKIDAPQMGFER